MSANDILKAIESSITEKEVNDLVQTYKRIIRDYLISGNEKMATANAEKLSLILTKYNKQ